MTTTYTRRTLPADLARYSEWPAPDIRSLNDTQRDRFLEIKDVICRYLEGCKVRPILSLIRLSHPEMLRRLNRCVSTDHAGQVLGWSALLPGRQLKSYTRKGAVAARPALTQGGYSGALRSVLETYPSLERRWMHFLLTACKDKALPESRVTHQSAHEYFLELCHEVGLKETDWPFCVEELGARSVNTFVNMFFEQHFDVIVEQQHGSIAKVKAATGKGVPSRLRAMLPLDIVEMDEHTVDFVAAVGIRTPKGITYVPIQRLVLIVLVDRFSQAILAYTAIVRRKVRSADIIATVAKALGRWKARESSLDSFAGSKAGGFPSACIDALSCCGFNQLLLDNDTAHLAEPVLSQIGEMAGCAINYGKVAHFERRPFIESINRRLASVFQRLPSTTGSRPGDPKRHGAEAAAVAHRIELQAVLDLVEAVMADHNASLPAGNFGVTPLDMFRRYADDPVMGFLRYRAVVTTGACDPRFIGIVTRVLHHASTFERDCQAQGSHSHGILAGGMTSWLRPLKVTNDLFSSR